MGKQMKKKRRDKERGREGQRKKRGRTGRKGRRRVEIRGRRAQASVFRFWKEAACLCTRPIPDEKRDRGSKEL